MNWYSYALLSAGAAAATAILAKVGVEGIPSTLATAIRTVVVAVLTCVVVAALGHERMLPELSRKTLLFLVLSGLGTALSWLAYFRALQLAPASWVAPIDKLSLPFTIVLASVFLGEPLTWQLATGVALMVAGAVITTV